MQKKPSLTKEEDDYEDDFHDDDEFEEEEEFESSADKKAPNPQPATSAKTPEIPTKSPIDNQKQSSGKASTSNDNFKDYGDYDDEDEQEEEEEEVAPKPKVTFPFQAAAPADPLS